MNRRSWYAALVSLCILLAAGAACTAGCIGQQGQQDSRLHVTVTVLPQAEIVSAVGGERVCVTVVVPPGSEPHTYEPSAGQLIAVSGSDIYFRLGPGLIPFEDNLVARIRELNPGITVVDSSAGMPLLREDDREDGGDHLKDGIDPHVWLSPSGLRVMTAHASEGLAMAEPAGREAYNGRAEAYLGRINATDSRIRDTLSGLEGQSFLVFHPAWGYFAREYGLRQVAVKTGGKEPGIRELSMLVASAREKGIRVVFADPQFSTRESEVIAGEINGTVVLLDPLSPDTLGNLERAASAIARSYGRVGQGEAP